MTTVPQNLAQRHREILLLMDYAVPAERLTEAQALLAGYRDDRIATNLLHAFYSYLPEGIDDGVREIKRLARREGSFLLAAVTFQASYLYLVTGDDALFLGDHRDGIWDQEVLDFFGLGDREKFCKRYRQLDDLPRHQSTAQDTDLCPACAVADGEEHVLGCPVEVCPWCGGQLTGCHCRFEQLERDHLLSDRDIEAFRQKLAAKGRIPFDSARHRPAYPTADDTPADLNESN